MVSGTATRHYRGMTENPPDEFSSGTQQHGGPRVSGEQMRDLSRLRRSVTDRKLAGVAGGVARHLDVDPVLVRVVLVVLAFFGGAGLLLYVAAWLLVPEEGQEEAAIASSPSTRTTVLIIIAAVAGLLAIGDGWGLGGFPWPLLVVGVIVAVVLANRDRHPSPGHASPGRAHQGQSPPGQDPSAQASGRPTQPAPAGTGAAPGSTTPTQPGVPPAPWSDTLQDTEPLPWDLNEQPAAPGARPNRGPRLFWPTLALVAIGLGILGITDAAGASVVDSAYPALALAVVGLMLTVGAWFGRTGGLIFLGVVAAVSLALSSLTSSLAIGNNEQTPATVAELDSPYSMGVGRIALDLTEIDAFAGERVAADLGAGSVLVTVPDDIGVAVDAEVTGGGEVVVDGDRVGGDSPRVQERLGPDAGDPDLTLDLSATFGRIEVRTR
jgi:phage shock protein PspC (stress-responsive transcriptional regulator)